MNLYCRWASWVLTGLALPLAAQDAFLEFAAPPATLIENGGAATIVVQRTGNTSTTITVDFETIDGTATGADYTSTNGTLTFAAGETSQTFKVALVDDTIKEGAETVQLRLSNPIGGVFGVRSNAVLVVDDDEIAGLVDRTFDAGTGPDNAVLALALQPDGRTLIGGQFNNVNGLARSRIARLEATGAVDAFANGLTLNGFVYAIDLQTNGQILIGGSFTTVNGVASGYVARLNSDGSPDTSFDPGNNINGEVRGIAVQNDGQIVIAGRFTRYGSTARNRVARLNLSGSLDNTFDPGLGADGNVHVLTLASDGKALIGGNFGAFNGTSRERIARLNTNGSLDNAFTPGAGPDEEVRAIVELPGGDLIIGGDFDFVQGVARKRIARLTAGGTLVTSFAPQVALNDNVRAVALMPGGRILAGGDFGYGGFARNALVRFNADGSMDEAFIVGEGANAPVYALLPLSDGRAIAGGFFTTIASVNRSRVARLNASGEDLGRAEFSIDALPTEETIGAFTLPVRRIGPTNYGAVVHYDRADVFASYPATRGADFELPGDIVAFAPGQTSAVANAVILNDGLWEPTSVPESFALRLFAPSAGFQAAIAVVTVTIADNDAPVHFEPREVSVSETNGAVTITVMRGNDSTEPSSVDYTTTEGTALSNRDYTPVSGTITFVGEEQSKSFTIPILNNSRADGDRAFQVLLTNVTGEATLDYYWRNTATVTIRDNEVPFVLDPTFKPSSVDGPIYALALLPNGQVLIGGDVTAVGGAVRRGIARLHTNGDVDPTFTSPLANGAQVRAINVLSNGQIYAAGRFALSANTNVIVHTIRLQPDGTRDSSFELTSPDSESYPDGIVQSLAVQPDGEVLIAGHFASIDGVMRRQVARLHTNGTLDLTFDPPACYFFPYKSALLQPDGKVLASGGGITIEIGFVGNCERFLSDGALDMTFTNRCGYSAFGPQLAGEAQAAALQPDGKILLSGRIYIVDRTNYSAIIRLNPDGSLDPTFNTGVTISFIPPVFSSGPLTATLALQPDGKVLAGLMRGTGFNGRNGIVRLRPDGALDETFNPGNGVNGSVNAIALLPGGKVLVGGEFTAINGQSRTNLALFYPEEQFVRFVGIVPETGQRRITLEVVPGLNYALQGSGDLMNWTTLGMKFATTATVEFIDATAAPPHRFYRASLIEE